MKFKMKYPPKPPKRNKIFSRVCMDDVLPIDLTYGFRLQALLDYLTERGADMSTVILENEYNVSFRALETDKSLTERQEWYQKRLESYEKWFEKNKEKVVEYNTFQSKKMLEKIEKDREFLLEELKKLEQKSKEINKNI